MSNARRRRERRLRSWWRHEAQSVAAALTAARHHSTGPREEVVTRREERQEGEVHEENDGLRAQTTPLSGVRPALPSEVAGPQAAVTVGYAAAGPPSLVVALVAVHDMWTRPRCSSFSNSISWHARRRRKRRGRRQR